MSIMTLSAGGGVASALVMSPKIANKIQDERMARSQRIGTGKDLRRMQLAYPDGASGQRRTGSGHHFTTSESHSPDDYFVAQTGSGHHNYFVARRGRRSASMTAL